MKLKGRYDEEPALNLTPLIDVVFQLLIFFMVATTFLNPEKEIGIELPEAVSGEQSEEEPDEILINVFADGSVIVSGESVARDALLDTLRARARANPQTPVTIRGDRLVHHEHIVAVMDACGQAGLLHLSVGTIDET
ncbi:MAG: ExbD/TolR family protein [Planctomycetota bacterium]|jgi:biopolymer transport protein ExbD